MFIVAKNREGLLDLNVLLLVFSARDIDFRKLLGTFSFATFLVLVLTIFASNKGVISNMIMRADSGYRFSLGFNYVSFASQRLFFALCSYLMFRGKKNFLHGITGPTVGYDLYVPTNFDNQSILFKYFNTYICVV